MNKLSAQDQREVLAEVPGTLLKLAMERDFYKKLALDQASRAQVEKIASVMLEKGLREGTVQSVADELEKSAAAGELDLNVTEQAVALVGPDMNKRASVSDDYSGSAGTSEFERFLLG